MLRGKFHVRLADLDDVMLVHEIMIDAYSEYLGTPVSSSALKETVESIRKLMERGTEGAALCFEEDGGGAIGSVRFRREGEGLYFLRLSVRKESQGRGAAKEMLSWLEGYASSLGLPRLWCMVRKSVPRNVHVYESIGYKIVGETSFTRPNGALVELVTMSKPLLPLKE